MKFNKRTYKNPKELFSDLCFPIRNRKRLKEVKNKGLISPAFQERLMLAVTAVEGCRYCSYFHARQALKSGVTPKEISQLLSGDVDSCPEEEAVAVI
jgi:AhpD family alkylhydroperoxidase